MPAIDTSQTPRLMRNSTPNSSLSAPSPSSPTEHANTSSENSTPKEPRSHVSKDKIQKRTLNTLAARRYRQKRLDQVQNLEVTLKETQSERDALKVRVARLEGEVEVLRSLLGK